MLVVSLTEVLHVPYVNCKLQATTVVQVCLPSHKEVLMLLLELMWHLPLTDHGFCRARVEDQGQPPVAMKAACCFEKALNVVLVEPLFDVA